MLFSKTFHQVRTKLLWSYCKLLLLLLLLLLSSSFDLNRVVRPENVHELRLGTMSCEHMSGKFAAKGNSVEFLLVYYTGHTPGVDEQLQRCLQEVHVGLWNALASSVRENLRQQLNKTLKVTFFRLKTQKRKRNVRSFRDHSINSASVSEQLLSGASASCRLFSREKLINHNNGNRIS